MRSIERSHSSRSDDSRTGAGRGRCDTCRGNQLAMSAGTATLKFMREEKLTEHEQHLGALLFRHLKQLQAEFSWVGDVRGRGLIVELGGRRGATVRFLPPLTITECEVKHVAQILYLSATSLNSGYSSE